MGIEELRQIRGEKVAYLAQSAIATFNPALKINEQVTESAVIHGSKTQNEANEFAKGLYHSLDFNPDLLGLISSSSFRWAVTKINGSDGIMWRTFSTCFG